ncbi:UNVERIFIED_CONTAM: Reticulon-like protein B1 [Sesamum indicum]
MSMAQESADVILWRNKQISAALLAGATVIWLLFERIGYHLITFICHCLILSLATLFLWSNLSFFVNKAPYNFPEIVLPEDLCMSAARLLTDRCNKAFAIFRAVAAILVLWVLSIIGGWFDFLTLVYIIFVMILTMPLLYERHEDQVDSYALKAKSKLQKQYSKLDEKVLQKLPKVPLGADNKQQGKGRARTIRVHTWDKEAKTSPNNASIVTQTQGLLLHDQSAINRTEAPAVPNRNPELRELLLFSLRDLLLLLPPVLSQKNQMGTRALLRSSLPHVIIALDNGGKLKSVFSAASPFPLYKSNSHLNPWLYGLFSFSTAKERKDSNGVISQGIFWVLEIPAVPERDSGKYFARKRLLSGYGNWQWQVLVADQRKAIMESFMAAQRYCMLTTCRRNFLLGYFGEKTSSVNCGTCDNCTNSKQESDMSREAFLLMACIQSCQGHWGLNLPVDVLRGSRVSYSQIKLCMLMQDMGISTGVISSTHQQGRKADESRTPQISEGSGLSCQTEGSQSNLELLVDNVDYEMKVVGVPDDTSLGKSVDKAPSLLIEGVDAKQPVAATDELTCSRKRQKLNVPRAQHSIAVEPTEGSVLSWLKNFNDGVTLSDLLEHFKGSKEEAVIDLLKHLEGEFLIFRKNNLYKLM